jgi:hypothetical protein
LKPMSKCEAFMRLVESAFNYNMHGRAGFEALGNVVALSRCFRFIYGGNLEEAVNTFDALAQVS